MADRKHITFRLGLIKPDASKQIHDESCSLQAYLGTNLLDVTSLSDNSHAIRLPLGSQTDYRAIMSLKVRTINNMNRKVYAVASASVQDLVDMSADKITTLWMKLDLQGGVHDAVPL